MGEYGWGSDHKQTQADPLTTGERQHDSLR